MSQKGWRTFLCVVSDLCSDFHVASAGRSQHQKGRKKPVRISLFLRKCPFFCCAGALKISIWGLEYITFRSERINCWIITGLGSETPEHTERSQEQTLAVILLVSSVKWPRGVSRQEQKTLQMLHLHYYSHKPAFPSAQHFMVQ